jgi:PAS domain S-box-containing protein
MKLACFSPTTDFFMRLSAFITQNQESILQAWEEFARTIEPPALSMDTKALRNHAAFMLQTITLDLDTAQSPGEQARKSWGLGKRPSAETYAQTHALQRLQVGYTINQLVSEYRALRASVLQLWADNCRTVLLTDPGDMTRFNEAVDQALAESVQRYAELMTESVETERLRLDATLQAAPVGIIMVERDGKVVLANAENKQLWGDHPMSESVAQYALWQGWWADDSEKHGQRLESREWALARALAGEEPRHDIVEIEPFDRPQVRKTILLRAAPIRDVNKRIVGAVVAQMDITRRVETEAARRDSETKFRTIANAMPQMVWSALPDGAHDYFNQQWYDFTGLPAGSTDGHLWSLAFHPDDRAHTTAQWQRSLATGELYEVHYRLRRHDGQYRWTLGRALAVRDEAGTITRWMGTCTDIHDQKLAEAELRQSNQHKDEFLAMLAHELRNPLAPISTAAQLLAMSAGNEARVRQTSAIISRQVLHMTALVDDLLDVSRVTRGLVELQSEIMDVKLVVASAVEQAQPLVESRGHALVLRLGSTPAFVEGDKTRLIQVLSNLLNNAAKYTPQNGEIVLSLEVRQSQVCLSVSDNGSGIAPSLLPIVFELFTQAERTPDRTQGGLGLGLALVKNIISLHGGAVEAHSEGLGKGSVFTITLPLVQRKAASPGNLQLAEHAAQAGHLQRPLQFMIVDDNREAGQVLANFLEATGHQVVVREDAESALVDVGTLGIEVFILDIGLPGMDGYELARRLRANPATQHALLVALTGYGQAHDRVLSRTAGFDHYFVKPIDMTQLTELLAKLSA